MNEASNIVKKIKIYKFNAPFKSINTVITATEIYVLRTLNFNQKSTFTIPITFKTLCPLPSVH